MNVMDLINYLNNHPLVWIIPAILSFIGWYIFYKYKVKD